MFRNIVCTDISVETAPSNSSFKIDKAGRLLLLLTWCQVMAVRKFSSLLASLIFVPFSFSNNLAPFSGAPYG